MIRAEVVIILKLTSGIIVSSLVGHVISIATGCALAMTIGVVLAEQDVRGGGA